MERIYSDEENVTLINYENNPSILDFSEEQALINYENGYETSIKALSLKR